VAVDAQEVYIEGKKLKRT